MIVITTSNSTSVNPRDFCPDDNANRQAPAIANELLLETWGVPRLGAVQGEYRRETNIEKRKASEK
ncbi:MAG TPA: hypothetical protein VGH74_22695, partial [Planctomycetaceae bacterium]